MKTKRNNHVLLIICMSKGVNLNRTFTSFGLNVFGAVFFPKRLRNRQE
jgi:hypothetical protein